MLYVVILSAALDLVGPNVPKGLVLLADVIPSFATKLCAPYFIHAIPYSSRIIFFVGLSACGMLLIALTPGYTDGGTISTKMAGVILASLSSGGGELSFLGLTHYYGQFSLAAWGSGTGGAGLIGAGAYALATTSWGLSVRTTLLVSAFLPGIMLLSFFAVLPRRHLRPQSSVPSSPSQRSQPNVITPAQSAEDGDLEENHSEHEHLLSQAPGQKISSSSERASNDSVWTNFKANVRRSQNLFLPL